MSRSSPRLATMSETRARYDAERRAAQDDLRAKRQKLASEAPYPTPPLTPPSDVPSPSIAYREPPKTPVPDPTAPAVRYTANKDRGLFSRAAIKRGDEIMRERPLWVFPDDAKPEELLELCEYFTTEQSAITHTFVGDGATPRDRIGNIARINGIPSGKGLFGLYETASRINHSCQPNAVWRWDAYEASLVLTAWTSIDCGEEITCLYLDELEVASEERQMTLLSLFGFDCACTACDAPEEEQSRRDEKIHLYHKIRKQWTDAQDDRVKGAISQWNRDNSLGMELLDAAEEYLEELQLWDAMGEVHEERLLLQIAWAEPSSLETAKQLREHYTISQGPAVVEKHYGKEPTSTQDFAAWGYARAAIQKEAAEEHKRNETISEAIHGDLSDE